jgi:hypothetical protein
LASLAKLERRRIAERTALGRGDDFAQLLIRATK